MSKKKPVKSKDAQEGKILPKGGGLTFGKALDKILTEADKKVKKKI